LSTATVSRIRKALGIKEFKNTSIPEIQKMVDYLEKMKTGDRLLSERQVKILQEILGNIQGLEIMPHRLVIDQFGDKENLLEGLIVGHIPNEAFPTVNITEGHPAIKVIVNEIRDLTMKAEANITRRDENLNELLKKAEKSRKLSLGEKIKRTIAPQNKEIFKALSGETVTLTREETAVVAYLKNFFAMVKRELGLTKFRKNYVTHMEQPLTEKIVRYGLFKAIRLFNAEQLAKRKDTIPTDIMLELDNIVGSTKFFKYALERKGGIDPTTNLRKILHEYSTLYETKMLLDEMLPKADIVMKVLLKGRNAVWLKKFMQNLKGRAMDHELRIGKANQVIRMVDTLINTAYIHLLSLNYFSAAKNIVAGESIKFIHSGMQELLTGKKRALENPARLFELSKEYGILEGTYADYAQMGISKIKGLVNAGMFMQQWGEYEIRGTQFAAMMTEDEWRTGKITSKRLNEIKDTISKTQTIFTKTDSPLWVQTTLGRMVMQMARWKTTYAMLGRDYAKGVKAEWASGNFKGPNFTRLLRLLPILLASLYLEFLCYQWGAKKLAKIIGSSREIVNNFFSVIPDTIEQFSNNPVIKYFKAGIFTLRELSSYMFGTESPRAIEINSGIEDIYIPAIEQFNSGEKGKPQPKPRPQPKPMPKPQ
jgi:hypothetical protein